MKMMFLINGNDAKEWLGKMSLPAGVRRSVGRYGENDLYVISFSIDAATVRAANTLAALRDSILESSISNDAKCLRDEASELFCTKLYPRFMRFERDLRMALTIAFCADQGNFNNKIANSLQNQTLGNLDKILFNDKKLFGSINDAIKGQKPISRERLLDLLATHNDATTWNHLFGSDMPVVKKQYPLIRERRNDVMHFHALTYSEYRKTLKSLNQANAEINTYIEGALDNVDYPIERAQSAREAVKTLTDTYSVMLNSLGTITQMLEPTKNLMSAIDTSWLQPLQEGLASYQSVTTEAANISRGALSNLDFNALNSMVKTQESLAQSLEPLMQSFSQAQAIASLSQGDFVEQDSDTPDGLDAEPTDKRDDRAEGMNGDENGGDGNDLVQ